MKLDEVEDFEEKSKQIEFKMPKLYVDNLMQP